MIAGAHHGPATTDTPTPKPRLNNRLTIRTPRGGRERRTRTADELEQTLADTFGLPVEPTWRPILEKAAASAEADGDARGGSRLRARVDVPKPASAPPRSGWAEKKQTLVIFRVTIPGDAGF